MSFTSDNIEKVIFKNIYLNASHFCISFFLTPPKSYRPLMQLTIISLLNISLEFYKKHQIEMAFLIKALAMLMAIDLI